MEIDLVILVAKGEALHDQSSVQEIDDLSKQKRHVKSGEVLRHAGSRHTTLTPKHRAGSSRERAASFDFRNPTTETLRRPRPTEARREESKKPNSRYLENLKTRTNQTGRIPQKHLERGKPSGKTDDSTSCRETAPGPSNGQQKKVANATQCAVEVGGELHESPCIQQLLRSWQTHFRKWK
ncbi:hypothetical protein J6590_041105 [Homalodisca vitripennis]|nr:hypothetical protein J6590_041105 [Homalodisca vitripennis]